jgi:hypothetical protein
MDYTTVAVARVVGAATGVGVLSAVLPNTSSGSLPIVALISGAAGGAILVSLLVSTIYKRVSG